MISPELIDSRPFMQRSIVLLPQPLGPQITTTWPFRISMEIPRRTCKLPNLLCTSLIRTIVPSFGPASTGFTSIKDSLLWSFESKYSFFCPKKRLTNQHYFASSPRLARSDHCVSDLFQRESSANSRQDYFPSRKKMPDLVYIGFLDVIGCRS